MAKVIIKQVKSAIHRPKGQKDTLRALGISRMNQSVEKEVNAQINGMISKVKHLIEVTEVK